MFGSSLLRDRCMIGKSDQSAYRVADAAHKLTFAMANRTQSSCIMRLWCLPHWSLALSRQRKYANYDCTSRLYVARPRECSHTVRHCTRRMRIHAYCLEACTRSPCGERVNTDQWDAVRWYAKLSWCILTFMHQFRVGLRHISLIAPQTRSHSANKNWTTQRPKRFEQATAKGLYIYHRRFHRY